MDIKVLPKWSATRKLWNEGYSIVDTTAKTGWMSHLSPFILGPCEEWWGVISVRARVFENLWQYSKVYPQHADERGEPTEKWFEWRKKGFDNPTAVRYPMGKGAIPLYSFWDYNKLGYIAARKAIYASLYAKYVAKTESYRVLDSLYRVGEKVVLLDYDAYDHKAIGMTLRDVINNPHKKMGHAFVLAMMLQGELEQCLI